MATKALPDERGSPGYAGPNYHRATSLLYLGMRLLAFVEISVDRTTPELSQKFRASVEALEEVTECHMVAGGFDYLVKFGSRTWKPIAASWASASPPFLASYDPHRRCHGR
jgi:DNA-binding Lrp family transcriptional regulator